MTLLILAAIGLFITAAATLYTAMQIRSLRLAGHYPERGQATMRHVESLISTGNRTLAMRAYREVHGASLKQAKAAVDNIINAA